MGSIGIISLTTRRNRRSSICRNIPVVKVRPGPLRAEVSDVPALTPNRRPAIRWSVTCPRGKVTDQGFDVRACPDGAMVSGMGPDLFGCV